MAFFVALALVLVWYLSWAVVVSESFFHCVWSLDLCLLFITIQVALLSTSYRFPAILVAFPLSVFSVALSPAQVLFFSKGQDQGHVEALEDLSVRDELSIEQPKRSFSADVVAVHGLASNPATTWLSRSVLKHEKPLNWLRDLLPNEPIKVRVLLFHHKTQWRRGSTNKILHDHSRDLMDALRQKRSTPEEQGRPLIFVGHSFGGLIIKQTFVSACAGGQNEFSRSVQQNTAGFIYLGTPHKGARFVSVAKIVSLFGYWVGSSTQHLDLLQLRSKGNEALHVNFMNAISGRCGIENVVCVFESLPESKFGFSLAEVVERQSAVIDGSQAIGFDRLHRDIQRFDSAADQDYQRLLWSIRDWSAISAVDAKASIIDNTAKDNDVLRSLAFSEMRDRRNNVDSSHPDTCGWILEQEGYLNWIENVRGFWEHHLFTGVVILEFFFSARGTDLQKTSVGMFRSLLHQLYAQHTASRPMIQKIYEEKQTLGAECHWHPEELEKLFVDALMACSQPQQITVFIDALDEAGEDNAKALARFFHRLNDRIASSQKNTKICISCRHFPIFANVSSAEICVEDHNREDITMYLRSELDLTTIPNGNLISPPAWSRLIDDLTDKACGLFQWASIVAPIARNCVAEGRGLAYVQREIFSLPAELDELYSRILANITTRRNPSETLHLFQWTCFAERPLSVRELRLALALDDASLRADDADSSSKLRDDQHGLDTRMATLVITLSGGLVEVVKAKGEDGEIIDVVQVVHQSVSDYLRNRGLEILRNFVSQATNYNDEIGVFSLSHHRLFTTCLDYIDRADVQWQFYFSLHSEEYFEESRSLRREAPFLEYASYSLFRHLVKAQSCNVSDEYLGQEIGSLCRIFRKWCIGYQMLVTRNRSSHGLVVPDNGTSLLQIASASGLRRVVGYQISMKKSANAQDEEGNTALHYAAYNGDTEIARLLIEAGATLVLLNNSCYSALHIAAGCGNLTFAELLLEQGLEVHGEDNVLESPLYVAAVKGQIRCVRLFLEHGANVNAQGGRLGNALQAAIDCGHEGITRLLIDYGANINATGGYYGNALQAAACKGHEGISRLLIEKGANINATGGSYDSALRAAACMGHEGIVRLLIKQGADVNLPGGDFGSALQAAAHMGQEDIIQLLINRGADINAQSELCDSALLLVSGHGSTKIVSLMLEAGADMNMRRNNGLSLLASAAIEGNTEVVELLLNKGLEVNDQDDYGVTALMYASVGGRTDIVNLLLDRGATINVQARDFGTALHMAMAKPDNRQVVDLLVERGADDGIHAGMYGTVLQAAAHGGKDVRALLDKEIIRWSLYQKLFDPFGLTDLDQDGVKIVALLLRRGANVNEQGGKYHTPLQAAAALKGDRSYEVVKLLLEWGADVNAQGGVFGNALQAAARHANHKIVKLLVAKGANVHALGGGYGTVLQAAAAGGNEDMVKFLLGQGAEMSVRGGPFGTVLNAAAAGGCNKIVKLFLDMDADMDEQAGRYGTALQTAVVYGEYGAVRILLERGVDVNIQAGKYTTALHAAAWTGRYQMVELLLKKGADTSVSVHRKGTALEIARRYGHKKVEKLLLEHTFSKTDEEEREIEEIDEEDIEVEEGDADVDVDIDTFSDYSADELL